MANIKKEKLEDKIVEFIKAEHQQGRLEEISDPEKFAERLARKIIYE